MDTGQVTDKPARGMNPEAWIVVWKGKPDGLTVTEPAI